MGICAGNGSQWDPALLQQKREEMQIVIVKDKKANEGRVRQDKKLNTIHTKLGWVKKIIAIVYKSYVWKMHGKR